MPTGEPLATLPAGLSGALTQAVVEGLPGRARSLGMQPGGGCSSSLAACHLCSLGVLSASLL